MISELTVNLLTIFSSSNTSATPSLCLDLEVDFGALEVVVPSHLFMGHDFSCLARFGRETCFLQKEQGTFESLSSSKQSGTA